MYNYGEVDILQNKIYPQSSDNKKRYWQKKDNIYKKRYQQEIKYKKEWY